MSEKRTSSANKNSAFLELGLKESVKLLIEQTQTLYLSDEIPWVVGYSGGKDSTATLQITWMALEGLPPEKRHKPVYVISTDTQVENPVVAKWVEKSLETMTQTATEKGLNVKPHRLTPAVQDTFWVNLIGKGYPAPRFKFRWCTERLKINPSNAFVRDVVKENGEAILILGVRKAESSGRSHRMKKFEAQRIREFLSPSTSLANCFIYSPIENWSNDDVWLYLMQYKNPWGYTNKDLLTMYQGASPDGECPLVLDTTTPSCGDSRFGCWVCTLVDKDKSMNAMVQNDEEKNWMRPLMKFRDLLEPKSEKERKVRDFRRMSGAVQALREENSVPGPYVQDWREHLLKELLKAQVWIQKNGPDYVKKLELISMPELIEIRRVWVMDKHEMEDNLPRIYETVMGAPFPGQQLDDNNAFGLEEMEVLKGLCGENRIQYELARELIHLEQSYKHMSKRSGLFKGLEDVLKKHFFENEKDAVDWAWKRKLSKDEASSDLKDVDEELVS